MANPYFTASGVPTQRSNGVSGVIRQEIAQIAAAFDKLPAFSGNLGKLVAIGASALVASGAITESGDDVAFAGDVSIVGAFATQGNNTLGNAQADTLTVSGNLIKGANGNWTLPAAASGDTLNVAALAGNYGVVQAQSMAGSVAKWQLRNTSTAASSAAQFSVEVGGTAAGDPVYQAIVTGGSTWTWGIDNSDSDAWLLAHAAALGGTTNRLRVSTAGVLSLPSAGASLDFSDISATQAQINSFNSTGLEIVTRHATAGISMWYGNATGVGLGIKSDGRLYGTAMHNNAGAMTGVAEQFFGSGTYTPTVTGTANVTGASGSPCHFARLGNMVIVGGAISIDPTTVGVLTTATISLPIPPGANFANFSQCGGGIGDMGAGVQTAAVGANVGAQTALFVCTPTSGVNNLWTFTLSYLILA